MTHKADSPSIRVLPETVANKIAAGEVVERPASVVKELVENALDAGATRIIVRVTAAGRRLIEVIDNGHGMSEQNALLAIERHATSKIRDADDLDAIRTLGFRGEALASIASVSRFTMTTRREKDAAGTKVQVDGGILRDTEQVGAPVGTRIAVNRLYFNTPVRAKFLKGVTTELGHCIDVVQRHALSHEGVGFQFFHNDRLVLDVPEHARLRERVALIWGLNFVKDMVEVSGEHGGYKVRGVIGLPGLTRAQRSHQFFFLNGRPVVNRTLQFGLEDGYRGVIMIGRHPVGVIMLETHPRFVDVNIHPAKREVRFRDERAVRDAIRDIVRQRLEEIESQEAMNARQSETAEAVTPHLIPEEPKPAPKAPETTRESDQETTEEEPAATEPAPKAPAQEPVTVEPAAEAPKPSAPAKPPTPPAPPAPDTLGPAPTSTRQDDLPGFPHRGEQKEILPAPVYQRVDNIPDAPLQLFDTYLLVPSEDRLLIIDQHALHERLNYDSLLEELRDRNYTSQTLAVPIVFEVAPAQVRLLERNIELFSKLGLDIEPFGGTSFQITAVCHLYDEKLVRDVVYQVLNELEQGDLFDETRLMDGALRLATRACHASVRGGDRLTPQERRGLLDGFHRLRPPYTCPHGRPIIVELTQSQMEKSFGRIQ
jgi:DNA mismatch repair protein MutL